MDEEEMRDMGENNNPEVNPLGNVHIVTNPWGECRASKGKSCNCEQCRANAEQQDESSETAGTEPLGAGLDWDNTGC